MYKTIVNSNSNKEYIFFSIFHFCNKGVNKSYLCATNTVSGV